MSRRTVEVMYFDGCPNVELALDRVRAGIASARMDGNVDIALTRIADDVQAARKRFLGSPTIQVDGRDVEPEAAMRDDYGLQCRVYWNDGRLEGAPPSEWVAAALAAGPPTQEPQVAEPSPSGSTRQDTPRCCAGKNTE
jgi:hypothetical protein